MQKSKLLKTAATFIISIGLTASMVFAGSIVYEKIFKNPEKIENFLEELKVTQEDLDSIISKEEVIKAPNYDKVSYNICTSDGISVNIDALTGKFSSFNIEEKYTVQELEKLTTTKENILEVAKNKMKEYGFEDDYKISYVSSNNQSEEEKSYYWYIWFSKEYDGLFNETQSVSMTIIPQVNEVIMLSIEDEPFDNNEVVVTKEQAINTAKEKDNIINTEGFIIKDISAELAIKRMNPYVYLKENGLTNGNEVKQLEDGTTLSYNTYKLNGKARKVYVVEISYENREFGKTRKYYVDATTCEIIGGENI